jgi:hypothetical protein
MSVYEVRHANRLSTVLEQKASAAGLNCRAIEDRPSSSSHGPLEQQALRSSGDMRTAISDGIVALLREYYGRGPGKARSRTALHDGMRAQAVAAVENITGRQVTAYLTAHEVDPDLAIIAFHFGPTAGLDEVP